MDSYFLNSKSDNSTFMGYYLSNGFLMDPSGEPCKLRRQTLMVFVELATHTGQLVEHRQLMKSVWPSVAVTDDSLVQCISEIRRTIGDKKRETLQTIHRRGYRLIPDTSTYNSQLDHDATPKYYASPHGDHTDKEPITADFWTKGSSESAASNILERLIAGQISQNLSDSILINLKYVRGNGLIVSCNGDVIEINIVGNQLNDKLQLNIAITSVTRQKFLWSRLVQLPADNSQALESKVLFKLAHQITDIVSETIANQYKVGESNALSAVMARAISETMQFDPQRMQFADELLASIQNLKPSPAILAWRAYIRFFRLIERTSSNCSGTKSEMIAFTKDASFSGMDNSMVLSLFADIEFYLNRDVNLAYHLASRAVDVNPGNAIALGVLATMQRMSRRTADSIDTAVKSLRITNTSPFRHWWELTAALSYLSAGEYEKSAQHANLSHKLCPIFKPPLRHLYAAQMKLHKYREAEFTLKKLRQIEPDFSLRLLREQEDFPAVILRELELQAP